MSSISLNILKQVKSGPQSQADQNITPPAQFAYSDIMFDLKRSGDDVAGSYDYDAIKNSIENLFNTMPGQWLLNPTMGIGLQQFIGLLITEHSGNKIAETIVKNLKLYEPRVSITKLQVIGDQESDSYTINLAIRMTNVNSSGVALKGTLTSSGFQFTT